MKLNMFGILLPLLVSYSLTQAQNIIRGPYMTMANQHSVVITWRTDIATKSKVTYGNSPGVSSGGVVNNNLVTEHVIKLSGLMPETKYYYTIGTNTTILQGGVENYFYTHPITSPSYNKPIRILAVGDVAKATIHEERVRDAFLNYVDTNYVNGYLMLGDNAYPSGLDSNFQIGFFNYFQNTVTKHTVLWPDLGNHEYDNDDTKRKSHIIPYYDIFTLPAQGECGGIQSNTEMYYSFDIGNIHFVNLDSYGLEAVGGNYYGLADTTMSPQVNWLKQDLAANTLPWTIVSFHHAPYCMGSHNSDAESDLASIREHLNPVLEHYNVDLVLNGHCHTYQRSGFIHDHFGMEATFDSTAHVVQSSSGFNDNTINSCPYTKNSIPPRPSDSGLIYCVVGSGSADPQTPQSTWPHAAMFYSNYLDNGALLLTIEGNKLTGEWINTDTNQIIKDRFTIYKHVNRHHHIDLIAGQSSTLEASWNEANNYSWSTGDSTHQITISPTSTQIITVSDKKGCFTDSFFVNLLPTSLYSGSGVSGIRLSPNPIENQLKIEGLLNGLYHVSLLDIRGKSLLQQDFNMSSNTGSYQLHLPDFPNGPYILKMIRDGQTILNKKVTIAH